jgi:hypothetical protein
MITERLGLSTEVGRCCYGPLRGCLGPSIPAWRRHTHIYINEKKIVYGDHEINAEKNAVIIEYINGRSLQRIFRINTHLQDIQFKGEEKECWEELDPIIKRLGI